MLQYRIFPRARKPARKKSAPLRLQILRRRKNGGSRNETKSQKLLDNRGGRAFIKKLSNTVVVAQLVRASDCGSEGRGFESLLPPQLFLRRIMRRRLIPPARRVSGGIFCFWQGAPARFHRPHKSFYFPVRKIPPDIFITSAQFREANFAYVFAGKIAMRRGRNENRTSARKPAQAPNKTTAFTPAISGSHSKFCADPSAAGAENFAPDSRASAAPSQMA